MLPGADRRCRERPAETWPTTGTKVWPGHCPPAGRPARGVSLADVEVVLEPRWVLSEEGGTGSMPDGDPSWSASHRPARRPTRPARRQTRLAPRQARAIAGTVSAAAMAAILLVGYPHGLFGLQRLDVALSRQPTARHEAATRAHSQVGLNSGAVGMSLTPTSIPVVGVSPAPTPEPTTTVTVAVQAPAAAVSAPSAPSVPSAPPAQPAPASPGAGSGQASNPAGSQGGDAPTTSTTAPCRQSGLLGVFGGGQCGQGGDR